MEEDKKKRKKKLEGRSEDVRRGSGAYRNRQFHDNKPKH